MAFAACARRNLALTIHSASGSSSRARVPRYFAAPQLQRLQITSPAHFSTPSALRHANGATSEANHVSTTGDATQPKNEISEAASPAATGDDDITKPSHREPASRTNSQADAEPKAGIVETAIPAATADYITKPSHEEASSQTDPQADAEPSLSEIQEDLGMKRERAHSLEEKLFQLTGRRPGEMSARLPFPKTTKEQIETYHKREDLIAKLAMGVITEEEANKKLKELEPQSSQERSTKKKRQKPKVKGQKVGGEPFPGKENAGSQGLGDQVERGKRKDNKPAREKKEAWKDERGSRRWDDKPALGSRREGDKSARAIGSDERPAWENKETASPAWFFGGRDGNPAWKKNDAEKPEWTKHTLGNNGGNKPAWTSSRTTDKPARDGREGRNSARKENDRDKPEWKRYKESLERKFEGASWRPAKRVSPDAVLGIRELHKSDPKAYDIVVLANQFKISKEAVRRILKSKFTPNDDEMKDKRGRWERRGEAVWKKLSDTGVRPPKKWREMGVSQGPAPWKKGKGGRRPKEAGYAWDEELSEGSGGRRGSFVGRID